MQVDGFYADFPEIELKAEDFKELLNDLSVSGFQLVADSLDSLKDLTESINADKTVPGLDIKKDVSCVHLEG